MVLPLLGHALEHREELPQVDHALVGGVLVHPLAQRAVVPRRRAPRTGLDQRLDDLLELGLVARVAVADRAPASAARGPRRPCRSTTAPWHELLADVLEDLRDAAARVLEQVPAEVELEALVGHGHPAPAEIGGRFHDADALALLGEQRGGAEARGARSDDDDVDLGHRFAFLLDAVHVFPRLPITPQ